MEKSGIERMVARTRASLARAIFILYAVKIASVWLALFGTLALILRITSDSPAKMLSMVALAGLIPCALASAIIARIKTPDRHKIKIKLDAWHNDGGILIASDETDIRGWESLIRSTTPVLKLTEKRYSLLLLLSIIYCAAGLLTPSADRLGLKDRLMPLTDIVDKLQAQVDLLEEEKLVDEERTQMISERIDDVAREASSRDPIKTWETLDHISQTINNSAEEAAESLAQDMETADTMEALAKEAADAMKQAANSPSESINMSQAMSELANVMKKQAEQFNNQIPKELADKLKNTQTLSEDDLKKLCRNMQNLKQSDLEKLTKMCKKGLIDPSKLKKCKSGKCGKPGEGDKAALMALLEKEGAGECAMMIAASCNQPGQGGISRGRGDAPMTWKDPSNESDVSFKEEVVAPASLTDLENSTTVGLAFTAPEINTEETGTVSGEVIVKESETTAQRARVLPIHRDAVENYFQRGDK